MGKTSNGKVREKEFVHKPDVSGFVDNSDLEKKIATLTAKAELKAEQDKIMKLQAVKFKIFLW